MSAVPDPKKLVWISPAMIGQKHKSADASPALKSPERPQLAPRAASFSATSEAPAKDLGTADASPTAETPAADSGTVSTIMSPHEDPVQAVGAENLNESITHSATIKTAEDLAALDPELAETLSILSEASKEWPSPSTEDSGLFVRTWISPMIAEYERWQEVKNNLKAMELILRSPFVPRTFPEWLEHRYEMEELKIKELCHKINGSEAVVALGKDRQHVNDTFGGKKFDDGHGGVLGLKTIWTCENESDFGHLQASWPCYQEMKEEGDERNTSGFGRFPALPRAKTNETVNYKHRAVIVAYPFDRVWPVPPAEMVDEGVGDTNDLVGQGLVGRDLLSAIDE